MNILSNLFLTAQDGNQNATRQASFWDYLPMILIVGAIVLFFVFSSRKSKRQRREAEELLNSIAIGDEIITIGGIEGRVVRIKDDHITIESGRDRTKLSITRGAVANVMKKQENV